MDNRSLITLPLKDGNLGIERLSKLLNVAQQVKGINGIRNQVLKTLGYSTYEKGEFAAQVRKWAWLQSLKMIILQAQGISRPNSQLKFSMDIGGIHKAIY